MKTIKKKVEVIHIDLDVPEYNERREIQEFEVEVDEEKSSPKIIKKEVIVVDVDAPEFNERKEIREFVILHENRENFFCQICNWPYYPECMKTCSACRHSEQKLKE